MPLPEVGLQAVIANMGGFNSAASSILSTYNQLDKGATNLAKSTSTQFVGLGNSIFKFAGIASGVALVGVGALTAGVVALGTTALGEVAKFERMSLSIQNLVAREISQGKLVEQATQVRIQLTEKENKELENLRNNLDNEANSRDVLAARIQEQKQRIIDLTAQYGENGLVVIKERAELQGMELDLTDLNREIGEHQGRITELTGKQGQLVNTLEKVRVGQISMSEAMSQAGPRAQELLKWIQLLAIQSPFTQEGIANAFRTTIAYGFTTEQAQRLTAAMVDFTAATGKSEQSAELIALALGQIQARGKVLGQELRQLSEQGVGTNQILERMGFTLKDVENGLVPVDEFIEAVIQDMEIFKGAAKDQATTFAGLTASLTDLKSIGLREFFTGTFEAIRPSLAAFVDFLTQAAFQTGSIRQLGDALGQSVAVGIANIGELVELFGERGLGGVLARFGLTGANAFFRELNTLFGMIIAQMPSFTGFGATLDDLAGRVFPTLTQGIQFVIQHFEEFKGALLGVGAVLAAGVFAALAATIIGLLAPINLIIAGAALLGAAWAGNWGDIQGKTFASWAVIQPILQQIIDWLQVNIPIAIQATSDFWTNTLQPAMVQVGAWITGTLIPTLTNLWNWLSTNIPVAIQTVSDFWTNTLQPALTTIGNYIQTNLFPLMQAFNSFLLAVFNKTVQAAAGLWQNVLLPALTKVWAFNQQMLNPVIQAIAQIFNEEVSPAIGTFSEDILPTLSEGLETVTEWIKKATDFFKGLADAVNNFELPDVLTPGSPPPMAVALQQIANAAAIAASAINTLTQGVSSSSPAFARLQYSLSGIQNAMVESGLVGEGRRHDIASIARSILPTLAGQFEAGTFTSSSLLDALQQGLNIGGRGFTMTQVLDALNRAGISVEELTQNLTEAFSEASKITRLANAARAVGLAGQFAQFGQAAADRLAGQIETLQAIVESGEAGAFGGQIIEATQAQELLNEALEDQAGIQQQIVDLQRQQADLQWLQQQISLIQMVRDAGLDVSDILGGITFGLDASIPDIVAAMNNVVQAMINQIDADLAIQSPSHVMADKFKQVMAGATEGIMSGKSMLQSAINNAISGPIVSAPAPGAGGSNGRVTNYNFDMSVNTGASPQAVIQQYEVMRAMVG